MKRNPKKKTKETGTDEVDPRFAPVVAAFARHKDVSRKKMFSSQSVLTVNGKIFSMLVKGKLVAKLPKERVDELVSGGKGELFDPGHGRLMKEWVALGGGEESWIEISREAYRFVKGRKS